MDSRTSRVPHPPVKLQTRGGHGVRAFELQAKVKTFFLFCLRTPYSGPGLTLHDGRLLFFFSSWPLLPLRASIKRASATSLFCKGPESACFSSVLFLPRLFLSYPLFFLFKNNLKNMQIVHSARATEKQPRCVQLASRGPSAVSWLHS